jgi:hypothetical protein
MRRELPSERLNLRVIGAEISPVSFMAVAVVGT